MTQSDSDKILHAIEDLGKVLLELNQEVEVLKQSVAKLQGLHLPPRHVHWAGGELTGVDINGEFHDRRST